MCLRWKSQRICSHVLLLQSQWDTSRSFCRITKVIKHILILLLQLPMECPNYLNAMEVPDDVKAKLLPMHWLFLLRTFGLTLPN